MAEMGIISDLSIREPDIATQLVLCCLAALEGADNQLLGVSLGANMGYNQGGLQLDPRKLAAMAAVQGVATNLVAPVWGMVADRGIYPQKNLMAIAAVGQGLATILLAFETGYGTSMIILRGFNGVFLAGLRPIANGVVAKRTSDHLQGKIFSRILVFIQLGTSLCSAAVAPVAAIKLGYYGDELILGWRPAWMVVGAAALLVAAFTMVAMKEGEVKRVKPEQGILSAIGEELCLFASFFKTPTFIFMVLQGIFGTIPWTVIWMTVTFWQIGGMSASTAGFLNAVNPLTAIIGTVLGGFLSDSFQLRFGANGRPLTAQITVALGIPFMFLNFYGLPIGSSPWLYFLAFAGFGIFGNWAQAGCNWPVLSQIVPEAIRSRVMAVEGAAENSLAAIAGPYFLAEISAYLGFNAGAVQPGKVDIDQASKMGLALAITTCTPWLLAFVVYSFLHLTFPIDLAKMGPSREDDADDNVMTRRGSSASFVATRTFSASGTHV